MENEKGIQIIYEAVASPEDIALAKKYQLPPNFYLYKNKPPCPGCRGCFDEIPPITTESMSNSSSVKKKFESGEFFADLKGSVAGAEDVKKLQMDFGMLLFSKKDCDIVIKVQGVEFPAHRTILCARSTVFRVMFTHEMLEKERGTVNIEDCDSLTFHNLLCYIYTGHCIIIEENVCSMYRVSDKYDIKELKLASLKYMEENLSVNVFCDVMSLAIIYNENKLIEVATEFFCEYAQKIVETPKWLLFLETNLITGNELVTKALSAVNKKLELCNKMHSASTPSGPKPSGGFRFGNSYS